MTLGYNNNYRGALRFPYRPKLCTRAALEYLLWSVASEVPSPPGPGSSKVSSVGGASTSSSSGGGVASSSLEGVVPPSPSERGSSEAVSFSG